MILSSKNDEFRIKNDEVCIKNDEFRQDFAARKLGQGRFQQVAIFISQMIICSLKTDDLSSKTMNSGIKNDEFCAARQVAMGQGQAEKAMVLLKVCIKTR